MDTGLKDWHIVVTGANGGIGTALATAFAKEGCKLTLNYHNTDKRIKKAMKKFSGKYQLVQGDLKLEKEVKELFKKANEKFGRVDGLVINHGIWPEEFSFVMDIPISRWLNTINTNLLSSFFCSKYFMKNLVDNQGDNASLIFIGSTAGVFGEAGHSDYAVTKAAMTGLMLSLKNEIVYFAKFGRVNLVAPGWTVTPMTEKFMDDSEGIKTVLQTMPLRKIARPEDVANTCVYLTSPIMAGHVSGQTIVVAGGMEGRKLFEKEEITDNW